MNGNNGNGNGNVDNNGNFTTDINSILTDDVTTLIVDFVLDGFWVAFGFLAVPLSIFFMINGLKKIAHN